MIEGGELTPDCNFEVSYARHKASEIKNKDDLFKILKQFLWNYTSSDRETYPMFNISVLNKDGKNFKEKHIDKGLLIPNPTKEFPFQILHEHTLEDAHYTLEYIDEKSPLEIEYQTYDDAKFLINIMQKKKSCQWSMTGDGGTQDQFTTLRYLTKKGKIERIRSSEFATLPLEFTDESEEEDIKNKSYNILVSKYFYNEKDFN